MAYGKIKADTLVYDNSGSDVEVTLSSLGSKANLPASAGTVGASEVVQVDANKDITGEPAGFAGHSGLTVKLKSNTTASPKVWEWQEYYANDPEIRYRKKLIVENLHTIDENYTIGTNNNAYSVGPVAVAANKTVTIPANSLYFIG